MVYKIGVLIPTTTSRRSWNTFEDTTIYQIFLQSFVATYNNEHNYIIYLIIDDDDKIFSNSNVKKHMKTFVKNFPHLKIIFVSSAGIQKGHVTEMWNRAFHKAYQDGCDYFFQCGDDIWFETIGWVNDSIKELKKHNNIGLTGPIDIGRILYGSEECSPGGERFIQTQSFVSRKHMEIFGFYFPKEIKNWFCDDWITKIYYPNFFYLLNHKLRNMGGEPRYDVVSEPPWKNLLERDAKVFNTYIKNN